MKKSIFTFLRCMALFLFLSPALSAQQTTTEHTDDIIIIQKATDENGVLEVERLSLKKGEDFKTYTEQLHLADMDGMDVKIEVFASEAAALETEENQEETIFIFKSAKTDHGEDVEKLVITINEAVELDKANPKPLLGVYSESDDQGVLITGIVHNSGAQKAGIQKGDIITALDNQAVNSSDDLSAVILKHEVGESILVDYVRNGTAAQLTATLGQKQTKRHFAHTRRSYDRRPAYKKFHDRDPCKVFIGVYTSNGRAGLKVHNLIPGTPADRSNVQVGDLIVALDDVEVNSHRTLVAERDKHQAGDDFTLSIIRDGQPMEIDAQFDACPTDKAEELVIIEQPPVIEEAVVNKFDVTDNTLDLESVNVFPKPTYGPVNLKFRGAAKPTTIRVTDASGKVVYEEVLNTFDGVYDNTIKFNRATPGTMILTIQQDQKIHSEALIFLVGA